MLPRIALGLALAPFLVATATCLADDIDPLKEAGPEVKGWTRVPIPPTGKLTDKSPWSYDAATGVLTCAGDESGHEWLRWDHELSDAVLHVEWRFVTVEGKKGYNSGMYIRNSADGKTWLQAQTGDASGGFVFGEYPAADGKMARLNLAKDVPGKPVKPAGEWNTFELAAEGPKLTLTVNGTVTNVWPDCPVKSGYVGLEAEGYRIEFRNVKVHTP